jgi:hypothetical protein
LTESNNSLILLELAQKAALETLKDENTAKRLSAKSVEKNIRESIFNKLPSSQDIQEGKEINISFPVESLILNQELRSIA